MPDVRYCGFWFEGLKCSKPSLLDYWILWDMLLGSWAFALRDLRIWQDFRMLFQRCLILDRASSASTKSLTSVMTQGVLCKPPREHSVQGWLWQVLEETSAGLYPPDKKEGHSNSRSLHPPLWRTPPPAHCHVLAPFQNYFTASQPGKICTEPEGTWGAL